MVGPVLEIIDVDAGYDASPVVSGVSFDLRPGRFLGLLGPNGGGKSTLLRVAMGVLRPRRGRVELGGRDLATLRRGEVARRVAVVPQDAPLPASFSCADIVLMGRTPHLGWLSAEGPSDRAVVARALQLVGADGYADRRVGELSGGERQRVVLARALAQEPDVLLLDEPTSHLDPAHQLAVLDLVAALVRTAGVAVLGVFHDLNLAAGYCDELLVLAGGRIVARGVPGAVLDADLIRRVYGVAASVIEHPVSGQPVVLLPVGDVEGGVLDGREVLHRAIA